MLREPSCPLSCCREMVLDSCPSVVEVVPLGSDNRWLDKLVPGSPFVVLVGRETEASKRVRMALTIAGISSLAKGGWTRFFFEHGVVVEAPLTLLSPEQACLWFPWLLMEPPVHLLFLYEGITDTWKKQFLPNGSWHHCTQRTQTFWHLVHMFLCVQVFLLMPIMTMWVFCNKITIRQQTSIQVLWWCRSSINLV